MCGTSTRKPAEINRYADCCPTTAIDRTSNLLRCFFKASTTFASDIAP